MVRKCYVFKECETYTTSKSGYCSKHKKELKELRKQAVKIFGSRANNWSLFGLRDNLANDYKMQKWLKRRKFL